MSRSINDIVSDSNDRKCRVCMAGNTICQCDCVSRGIHDVCIVNGVAGEWCCYIYNVLYMIYVNVYVYICIYIYIATPLTNATVRHEVYMIYVY